MNRQGPAPAPVALVQHVPWEGPGLILPALSAAGLDTRTVRLLDGEAPPDVEALAGLVMLGGPMRATDHRGHPALELEIELLREAVALGLPVLGICLGHQLLGLALGGELLTDGALEVGVAPVRLTSGSALGPSGAEIGVLHWHADQVSLPPGCELLARSDLCENQAFRLGVALGLQFHLEVDRPMLREWLTHPRMRDEVPPGARIEHDFLIAEDSISRAARAVLREFIHLATTHSAQT